MPVCRPVRRLDGATDAEESAWARQRTSRSTQVGHLNTDEAASNSVIQCVELEKICVCLEHSTRAIKVGCAARDLVDNLRCLTHHVGELTLIFRYVMSNPPAVEDRSNMSFVVARD